jgi:very-short-patch-repair endonuclease
VVKEQTVEERLKNARLTKYARSLRRNQTDAERKFWEQVRSRRQYGI